MTRRQRQQDQLLELCHSGSLVRAIDLGFEHFADFGRNDDVLRLLLDAIERTAAPESVRRRFAELCASSTTRQPSRTAPDVECDIVGDVAG
ncbi:MAG: hypothetical protein QOG49_1914 [Frankiaceae bacterium]|jgi:hypothetical protein|nr:hypothetical protein [Frankiaceae bacterium]